MDINQLKALMFHGLSASMAAHTARDLGDRRTYVGASDVSGCIRKAALGKRSPGGETLAGLLRMRRGHVAESIFRDVFEAAGVPHRYQVEAVHPQEPWIKAHVDFVLEEGGRPVAFEVKTTDGVPSSPHAGWVRQLHQQMGLLTLAEGLPAAGMVAVLDVNSGDVGLFNGYTHDPEVFEALLEKARRIRFLVESGEEPGPGDTERGPLCGWCRFLSGCPAIGRRDGLPALPIEGMVEAYVARREEMAALEEAIEVLGERITDALRTAGLRAARAGDYRIGLYTRKTPSRLDRDRLRREIPGWERFFVPGEEREYLKVE